MKKRTNSLWGYTDDALIDLNAAERRDYLRRVIWERDGGKCRFCEQSVDLIDMHLDHAVPQSLGGPTHWMNLRAAHRRCNVAAGNRKPVHGQMPLSPTGKERRAISLRVPVSFYDEMAALSKRQYRTIPMQVFHLAKLAMEHGLQDIEPPYVSG